MTPCTRIPTNGITYSIFRPTDWDRHPKSPPRELPYKPLLSETLIIFHCAWCLYIKVKNGYGTRKQLSRLHRIYHHLIIPNTSNKTENWNLLISILNIGLNFPKNWLDLISCYSLGLSSTHKFRKLLQDCLQAKYKHKDSKPKSPPSFPQYRYLLSKNQIRFNWCSFLGPINCLRAEYFPVFATWSVDHTARTETKQSKSLTMNPSNMISIFQKSDWIWLVASSSSNWIVDKPGSWAKYHDSWKS